jgi:hypothetical protein
METETIKDTPVRYSSRFEIAVGRQDMGDRAVQAIFVMKAMLNVLKDTGKESLSAEEIYGFYSFDLKKITLEEVEDLLFLMWTCALISVEYNKFDMDRRNIKYSMYL